MNRDGVNFGPPEEAPEASGRVFGDPGRSISVLERLAGVASALGAEEISGEAFLLSERLAEARFFVACVGQYKRGKSTLLNALVGADVLPTGVAPVTSVVTVLRYGAAPSVRVRTTSGRWDEIALDEIGEYVTEERNPGNQKGIAGVEVFWPSPLLEGGMCLVDTPGVGSVVAANTVATREFVPQIDAALVVLGADPPISSEEIELVDEIVREVDDLLFVINKADRLPASEVDEARSFTERVLAARLRRPMKAVLVVSASECRGGRGPTRDWETLRKDLDALSRERSRAIVRSAEDRGARRLAEKLLHEVDEQIGALTRPIEESEKRIESLRKCAAEAERSMQDLSALFSAEQHRLAGRFAEQQEQFLTRALPLAREQLFGALQEHRAGPAQAFRERAFTVAQRIFSEALERWRQVEEPVAEELYRSAARRFIELANGFLDRLAASGEPGLESLPRAVSTEVGFTSKSRVTFTEILALTSRSPIAWLRDACLPRSRVRRRIEHEALAYLERLFATNSARLKNNLEEQVLESRRRLELEIREELRAVHATAERALERARARLGMGRDRAGAALRQLEEQRVAITRSTVPGPSRRE